MYAIFELLGRQFKVQQDSTVRVPYMKGEPGDKVMLENVLVVSDSKNVQIGRPYLDGKTVEAQIIRHGKEKKITVFKKKRRKKYRKKIGHRQQFTEIMITGLPS